MSRRKQSKPRAFLKHDDGGVHDETHDNDGNLLDPKAEILSDVESNEDNDHNEFDFTSKLDATMIKTNQDKRADEKLKGTSKIDKQPLKKNAIKQQQQQQQQLQQQQHQQQEKLKIRNAKKTAPPSATDKENFYPNNEKLNEFFADDDEVLHEGDDVDDDVEDDIEEIDNDDGNSSDSFYSDIYSTHTSSSYSPSMSEGAATPNSLQHHPHLLHSTALSLLHPHHHNNSNLSPHPLSEGEGTNRLRSNTISTTNHHQLNRNNRRRRSTSITDGLTNGGGLVGDTKDTGDDKNNENPYDDESVKKMFNDNEKMKNLEIGNFRKMSKKMRKLMDREALSKTVAAAAAATTNGLAKNGTDGSYQCQFCDKSFPRLGYLKKHEQSHAEHLPFKCDYCARLFKHKRSRDRHTKLHTGDRRYRCPHCEAAFSRSDHLKIHMKTHDNQKPFQCTVCNRGYNTAAALTSHMQNHKKQAALLGTGLQPLNYSPRSTGSGSSNGSYNTTKRRYNTAVLADNSPATNRLDYSTNKKSRISATAATGSISCLYCTKSDFANVEQLNVHMQAMHENAINKNLNNNNNNSINNNNNIIKDLHKSTAIQNQNHQHHQIANFHLNCEYCTMRFPNIPTMFQHMRSAHIDRLSSPNSYFENFNRLAASGTFSPRLITTITTPQKSRFVGGGVEDDVVKIKREEISPIARNKQDDLNANEKDDGEQINPTDLSQPKKRAQTPIDTVDKHQQQQLLQQHSAGSFMCNQCNAALPDFETFRNHLKTHITHGMSLACHHCGVTLRDQNEYEHHTFSHFLIMNTEFPCTGSCQKTFSKTEELQKHLYDSHAQIMYKCSLCSDLFDTKVAIQVHFACAHSNGNKIYQCSACIESFRNEKDFAVHIKTRHQISTNGSQIQCMFCRAVCSSELEMHFHLAAHARQFRCPSCPETFHVEFLLDRHMQTHHGGCSTGVGSQNDSYSSASPAATSALTSNGPNQLFLNAAAQYVKQQQNNNNNILDYHNFNAGGSGKSTFPIPASGHNTGKFYSPLQVDTNSIKHPALIYGLGQRYFDAGKSLLDTMFNYQQEKSAAVAAAAAETANRNYFVSPARSGFDHQNKEQTKRTLHENNNNNNNSKTIERNHHHQNGFSCGMCERNDFRTEAEVHSHRKIVHNLKTGVSLRCAYCSGNYKSRSELEHHMKTCHNSTGKHKCLICDEIFPSPAILAEHKLQHSKVGQSGKCSHCLAALNDVAAFKNHINEHNTEGQIPVQCICCRQTLNSDFEIGLHAKFHTKSSGAPENACALCLEAIPLTSETRVCEKCCRKHNLSTKFSNMNANRLENHSAATTAGTSAEKSMNFIDNRCNLCKMILPHAQRLQEHLVEHTFVGCEERGYSCYICSAVFTTPAGLLNHMSEHGQKARPYDCNYCPEKFFFRAELDNHLIDHENKGTNSLEKKYNKHKDDEKLENCNNNTKDDSQKPSSSSVEVKQELIETTNDIDDDEYIEVEKVPEINSQDDNNHDDHPADNNNNNEIEKD